MMRRFRAGAWWSAVLALGLLGCSSDSAIRQESGETSALRGLQGRFPFLVPMLADARERPALRRPGGFEVRGRGWSDAGAIRREDPVRMRLGALASEGFWVDAVGASIRFRRSGAGASVGEVLSGVTLYKEVFPGAHALVVSRENRVEELIVSESAEVELRYEAELPAGWRLQERAGLGLVEVKDELDRARMRVWATKAWNEQGEEVPLAVSVRGSEIRLKARSDAGALVIDPLFAGATSMLFGRSEHPAVTMRDGRVLLVGGYSEGQSQDTAEVYDPSTGTFAAVPGRLTTPRRGSTATLLGDGRVLVAGGRVEQKELASAEIYDPEVGQFAELTTSLSVPRRYHTATLLGDGRVLIAGGTTGGTDVNSADVYDPAPGVIAPLSSKMSSPRLSHTATLLADGRVLLAGGFSSSTADLFDPTTNKFSKVASGMGAPRRYHTATLLGSGRVLLAGGYWGQTIVQGADLFDPATNAFLPASPLTLPRSQFSAARMPDGRVLLVGGEDPKPSAELYDPVADAFQPTEPPNEPRVVSSMTVLATGRVLLAGGKGPGSKSLASTEVYDPKSAPSSVASTKMGAQRYRHRAELLPDGRVLVMGGSNDRTSDFFDPKRGLFLPVSSLRAQAREHYASAWLLDGRLLVSGGWGDVEILDSVEVFDPKTSRFDLPGSKMNLARVNHSMTTLKDGRVLIAGGDDGDDATDSAEIYDPQLDQFTLLEAKLTWRRLLHTATLLPDGRVLLAGGFTKNSILSSAELFDPVSGQFSPLPSGLVAHRGWHTATALQDGRVLLAGGYNLNLNPSKTAEIFDPAKGTFSLLPAKMTSVRSHHRAALLPDGRVLLAGGFLGLKESTASAEIFDPQTGVFTATSGKMSFPRTEHTATTMNDGRVLLTGGYGDKLIVDSGDVFDPATGEFSPLSDVRCEGCVLSETHAGALITGGASPAFTRATAGSAPVPGGEGLVARRGHTATLTLGGKLLLVGGRGAEGEALRSVEGHDPATGQGVLLGELSEARVEHSTTRLSDGTFLVLGGRNEGGPALSYEILDDGARPLRAGKLAYPRVGHAATLLPDGTVLVAGGGSLAVEVFNPRSGEFLEAGPSNLGSQVRAASLTDGSVILSGSARTVRFTPWGRQVTPVSTGSDARLATLSHGDVIACGATCSLVGVGSEAADAKMLALQPEDQLKHIGTDWLLSVGKRDTQGWFGWVSAQPIPAVRPAVAPLSRGAWAMGEVVSLAGQRLLRGAGVGVIEGLPSQSGVAVAAWRPLDGGPVHLLATRDWSNTSVSVTIPRTAYTGPGWVYVVVDGVASDPVPLTILPSEQAAACLQDAECLSGHCVDGVCCDQPCLDGCKACSAALKGQGQDGVCEAILAGGMPRSGCENPEGSTCGFTTRCDGTGVCELPGLSTVCNEEGHRCQGGLCKPPPDAVCDEALGAVVIAGTPRSCEAYRCKDGACLTRCSSHGDCSPGYRCNVQALCEQVNPTERGRDPGWLCSAPPAGPGGTPGWPPWALGLLGVAFLVRRRFALAPTLLLGALAAGARRADAQETAASAAPAGSAPVPPPDPAREEARDLLKKGLALYEVGETQKALDFFLRSRAVFPAKGNTINAANCLRELGRLDESLELYEEAVANFSRAFEETERQGVAAAMAELRDRVGSLFVSANVAGAVVVDGRARGKLPLSAPIRLMPGTRSVRILKDGYRTFEGTAEIKPGETSSLDARLSPLEASGGLRVEDPLLEGAEVLVDGVVVGKAPWEGTLAPGPHVISSRRGADGSAPTLATVLQGQTALLRLKSGRLGPELRLVVKPASAELRLGEVPLGKGPWLGALPAGTYLLQGAEEGYQSVSVPLTVSEEGPPGGVIEIELPVEEGHPRWPRRPTGRLRIGAVAMYSLGPGTGSGAAESCSSGGSCAELSPAHGPVGGLRGGYEFPFRLSLEALLGAASLRQEVRREVAREGVSYDPPARYRMEDRVRVKGYLLAVGVGYGVPLGGSWTLRPRVMGGVMLARSSDHAAGQVLRGGMEKEVSVDGAGQEVSSSPFIGLCELGVTSQLGGWEVGGALAGFFLLSTGPELRNGAARVQPDCPGPASGAPGCVADSGQFQGERAYKPFAMIAPQLSVTRVF